MQARAAPSGECNYYIHSSVLMQLGWLHPYSCSLGGCIRTHAAWVVALERYFHQTKSKPTFQIEHHNLFKPTVFISVAIVICNKNEGGEKVDEK